MHENEYVHFDIKPDNILWNKQDNAFVFKLSDFGLSRKI